MKNVSTAMTTVADVGRLRLRWCAEHSWEIEVLVADPVIELDDRFLEALQAQDRVEPPRRSRTCSEWS